jgi:hypothetical protein
MFKKIVGKKLKMDIFVCAKNLVISNVRSLTLVSRESSEKEGFKIVVWRKTTCPGKLFFSILRF